MKKNWRIILGILSIAFIIGMWLKKGISLEMNLSMFFTTILVSLTKVIVFAGLILFIKTIISKIRK